MFPHFHAARPGSRLSLIAPALVLASMAVPATAQTVAEPGRLEIGFEERIRNEDWNNATDMSDRTNDEREQLRFRTRAWINVPTKKGIDVFFSLMDESSEKFGQPSRLDEVFVDNAYINFQKLFVKGLALRVGRQNIQRGEGFLLYDGTPQDGSRTGYYNAANLNYTFRKSTVELIGILDPAKDRFFPRWHDQSRTMQTWDEQAVGLYYTDRNHQRFAFDAYYFLKKEIHDIRPATSAQFQPDRHTSTAGGRLMTNLNRQWTLTSEAAYQWGAQHGGSTISGWGAYTHVVRRIDHKLKPYVKLGYWALSGDDPKTRDRIEGWDPLFSQWAKWSEMYVYTQGKEVGAGYWTNLAMSQAEAGFAPHPKVNVRFTWYHMNSFQPFAGSPAVFGSGTHRGENYQTRAEFNLRPDLKAYIHYETQRAGNFYIDRPAAYFLQAQLTYQFRYHPTL